MEAIANQTSFSGAESAASDLLDKMYPTMEEKNH